MTTTTLPVAAGRFVLRPVSGSLTDGLPSAAWLLLGDGSGPIVINEPGNAVSFRIESQNFPHLFYLDGANDRIGLNQPSPVAFLDIVSPLSGTGVQDGVKITANASGGDAGTVHNGLQVIGDVTADLFSHMNVILGWSTTQTVSGTYQGVEGRVDSVLNNAGQIGVGVLGRASGNNAISNSNILCIGVDGQAIKGDSGHSGSGTYYGGRFFATDGSIGRGIYAYAKGNTVSNVNAEFGEGVDSGDNGVVIFNGYITDGAGKATAQLSVNDVLDQFLVNCVDTKLDGFGIWLRDGAGASKFSIYNNLVSEVFGVDSSGNFTVPRIKSGTFTRVTSVASGDQSITGVGFKPSIVFFMYDDSGAAWEGGYGWSTGAAENFGCQNTTIQVTAANCIYYNAAFGGTNTYTAVLKTFDSDGFTLTWTKAGSPTATLNIRWFAIQ